MARLLVELNTKIYEEPSLKEVFVNPETNLVYKEGDIMKRLKFAETLETIAIENSDALYNGSLTDGFIDDVQNAGGILTKEDLQNYSVLWGEPVKSKLVGGFSVYSVPLPGSGVILNFMLNIINGFIPDLSINSFHRMIESFKYAYAERTKLGDIQFEEHVRPVSSQHFWIKFWEFNKYFFCRFLTI